MKFWQLHLPALSGGALFAGGLRPSKFDFLQHKFSMDEDVNVGWLQPHSPPKFFAGMLGIYNLCLESNFTRQKEDINLEEE